MFLSAPNAWEVPLFSKNEPNFSIKIGFTWETNPALCDDPDSYFELPPRPDVLVEPFPGADACRFIWTVQRPAYHIFHKMMRAAGERACLAGEGGRATFAADAAFKFSG